MPRLRMLRGPEPNLEIELDKEVMTIGRGRKNDIIIQDNEVSREHCRLMRVLDDYEIHDLGSTNGTFVNGQAIDENGWLLSNRHIIELGDSITLEYLPTEIISDTLSNLARVTENPYFLVVRRVSKSSPEIYELEGVSISLGRDLDNDYVMQEAEVSRHHLRFVRSRGTYYLEDLGTLNGTFLNGERLTEQQPLSVNDHIRIGTMVEMWFTDDPESLNIDAEQHTRVAGAEKSNDDATNERPSKDWQQRLTSQATKLGTGLQPEELEGHVFIAYARSDWDTVYPLYAYLRDQGTPVWVDQYLLPNSKDWNKAIDQAQSESSCLLAVLSQESVTTDYVIRSIRHFLAREKPILLMQYEDVDRPLMIQNMPAVTHDAGNPERAYRTILAEIRKLDNLG